MGITLNNMTGADSNVVGPNESNGNPDEFTYKVDVSSGETVTLSGDWDTGDGFGGVDGPSFSNGNYSAADAPTFGTFSLDSASGLQSWQFNYDDLLANGGLDQTVSFQVTGTDIDGFSDTDTVNVVITCFLGGTMIGTPKGSTAVEALHIGDLVSTADGREVPVKWIGRQTVSNHVFLSPKKAPVVISAGALGGGLPTQDLLLSADHGMIMDGMVVNAGAMVNGGSIRFLGAADLPDTFTYYHIETEAHDEIIANGAAAESFVDYVGRTQFDNYQEYVDLYGADRMISEMPRLRISSQRLLPASLRERLGIETYDLKQQYCELMAQLNAA